MGAVIPVGTLLLRSAQAETPHFIGVSGLGVVEFSRKNPENVSLLATFSGTQSGKNGDLPPFFHRLAIIKGHFRDATKKMSEVFGKSEKMLTFAAQADSLCSCLRKGFLVKQFLETSSFPCL